MRNPLLRLPGISRLPVNECISSSTSSENRENIRYSGNLEESLKPSMIEQKS